MIFLKLFIVFSKIGIFNFGGGYAMLSLIQHEVVEKNHWLTNSEFTDIVAISQTTPGPIGINCATYSCMGCHLGCCVGIDFSDVVAIYLDAYHQQVPLEASQFLSCSECFPCDASSHRGIDSSRCPSFDVEGKLQQLG